MTRGCALLALGLGLWVAAVGRAQDPAVPAAPGVPVAPDMPAALGAAVAPKTSGVPGIGEHLVAQPSAPAADCGDCATHCPFDGCLRQMLRWWTYRRTPAPPCCKTCLTCRHACACYPQLYTFFLSGPSPCCGHQGHHACGCAGPGCGSHGNEVVPNGVVPTGGMPNGAFPNGPAEARPVQAAAPHP